MSELNCCEYRSDFVRKTTITKTVSTYITHIRFPLRNRLKSASNTLNPTYPMDLMQTRKPSLKARQEKLNGIQKIDLNKRKSTDYVDMAYKEAVSKLKCLLAESYSLKPIIRKSLDIKDIYQIANIKITEPKKGIEKSLVTGNSEIKDFHNNINLQAISPELNSFIKQQEEYIQQLEQESQFCRKQVTSLLQKVREATQDANKYIGEKTERKYNPQIEQLSSNILSHWDVTNKFQLETGRKGNELIELKRELSQKQALINNLKIEFQNKLSNLRNVLTQALTEKDIAEQELLTTKLMAEKSDRQHFQEQSKLQIEINSYRQQLEKTDTELIQSRRENLKLSEQIAALEKEINAGKYVCQDNYSVQSLSKLENKKQLSSTIVDPEVKHEKVTMRVGKSTPASKRKRIVKVDLKLKVVPKQK